MKPCFKALSHKKGRFPDLMLIYFRLVFTSTALHLITSQLPLLLWRKWRMPQFHFWTDCGMCIQFQTQIVTLLVVKPTIAAIKWKYENIRRQWKSEGKEGHAEMVQLEGVKNRRIWRVIIYICIFCGLVFHQQKFDNHKSVVRHSTGRHSPLITWQKNPMTNLIRTA